jgi:hypothetical protein
MVNEEFEVYIEEEDGSVILDETLTAPANGFIDLWLPRDRTLQITITHGDKSAESELSTFEGDDTCITTMQLM